MIEDKIRDEKLQYEINREAAEFSALSSGKTDKHESFEGEKILLSDQRRALQLGKFTHSLLGHPLEKQAKPIKDQGKMQFKLMENNLLNPSNLLKKILILIEIASQLMKNRKIILILLKKSHLGFIIQRK